MKLDLKWLTPILLRLLPLSQASLAKTAASAWGNNPGSVQLVTGFYVGLAVNSQPRADLSLDATTSFVQLANHELTIPVMPLHLLGKKSWNVYNQDNIERVKQDEAAAKAKEAAEEERMQEIDAERRLQILRGERPAPLPITKDSQGGHDAPPSQYPPGDGRERKKRKRADEDDTDFELRLARDQTTASSSSNPTTKGAMVRHKPTNDTPLTDQRGHIDLFPQAPVAKNTEAMQEAAKKKKEYEDQYTMRFSNAAGFKQSLEKPWYSQTKSPPTAVPSSSSPPIAQTDDTHGKDVWGNEDPRRRERDATRTVAHDPLAMMRQGAARARQVERERKAWMEEKERELRELRREERERKKRRRRHEDGMDGDDLEGFSLDREDENEMSRPMSRHDRDRDERRKSRHKDSHSHRRSHHGETTRHDRDRRRHRSHVH